MMLLENEVQRMSLALSVACGRSVRAWAKRHDVDYATAYECSIQNEFRALVDRFRLKVADPWSADCWERSRWRSVSS
jgi:hypothetical protein